MKIINCIVENFASYKHLEFDFDGQGLVLVSGPTGSGKSTLCDIVPWVLFGRTAKNGAVDEVISWPGDETTYGRIMIEIGDTCISIVRTRQPNDLYFSTHPNIVTRGKDLNDTQNLINSLLGMDINLYLSGAYFHEFSQTAQFFTTTAKIRRQITEQLVDLSLAKTLTERMSEYKKEVKAEQSKLTEKCNISNRNMEYARENLVLETRNSDKWEDNKTKKKETLYAAKNDFKKQQNKLFEKELAKYYVRQAELETEIIEGEVAITSTADIEKQKEALKTKEANISVSICSECGNVLNRNQEVLLIKEKFAIKQLEALNDQKIVVYNTAVKNLKKHLLQEPQKPAEKENPYISHLNDLIKEENPHFEGLNKFNTDVKILSAEVKQLIAEISEFNLEHSDLELLLKVTEDFRRMLVKNTIIDLENNTNKILTDHFDAEIRVKFEVEDADKLEVSIWKDGNTCVYTQLSKGQRQLLKLSFGISVMRAVANHHGVQFNAIFLDEALDGLDEVLKVKAYGLLQKLEREYESVFCVEHSTELKSMFGKQYHVSLENGHSVIEES